MKWKETQYPQEVAKLKAQGHSHAYIALALKLKRKDVDYISKMYDMGACARKDWSKTSEASFVKLVKEKVPYSFLALTFDRGFGALLSRAWKLGIVEEFKLVKGYSEASSDYYKKRRETVQAEAAAFEVAEKGEDQEQPEPLLEESPPEGIPPATSTGLTDEEVLAYVLLRSSLTSDSGNEYAVSVTLKEPTISNCGICGGKAFLDAIEKRVYCSGKCNTLGPVEGTRPLAIKTWNKWMGAK